MLIDDCIKGKVRVAGKRQPQVIQPFIPYAKKAMIIQASNVAEYFYCTSSQEIWDLLADFPCVASPAPEVWVEWKYPLISNDEGTFRSLPMGGKSAAMLIITHDAPSVEEMVEKAAGLSDEEKINSLVSIILGKLPEEERENFLLRFEAEKEIPEVRAVLLEKAKKMLNVESESTQRYLREIASQARWRQTHIFFSQFGKQLLMLPAIHTFFIDKNGNVIPIEKKENKEVPFLCQPLTQYEGYTKGSDANLFFIPFFTFTLMHCKNVEVMRKKRSFADRPASCSSWRTTYYTLEINPMKQILREEGQADIHGLQKALHICRGHFAEYGPEYGKGKLFGKLEGRYWIPQHVKGSAQQGIVQKDYRIVAPE